MHGHYTVKLLYITVSIVYDKVHAILCCYGLQLKVIPVIRKSSYYKIFGSKVSYTAVIRSLTTQWKS